MKLKSEVLAVSSLSESLIGEMYSLFDIYYDAVNESRFRTDLMIKDEVVILHERSKLKGFSTMAWNPSGISLGNSDLLFSGDTIIAREAWGSQSLVKAFCRRVGEWSRESGRRVYWLLISKGHRTYLYLPLFGQRFYPDPVVTHRDLRRVAFRSASQIFGDAFDVETGLVRFSQSRGQLKPSLAADSEAKGQSRHVKFFLQKNPDFAAGVELVGLMELSADNLKSIARSAFLEGFESVVK